jgi:A/G-specific adenine glycosylase
MKPAFHKASATTFAHRLIAWQAVHGRHGLPWQATRHPYAVWLSEIMLQQTQVVTVKQYFNRFMQRFPTVDALASAQLDDVLALWSGLGYYSRARNLHLCAKALVRDFGGEFPTTSAQLVQLPGIGPSTAAAIATFCFGERVSIMDANVQRVVGRYLAFDEDLASQKNVGALWQKATGLLPQGGSAEQIASYTQALMDLGAGICSVKAPNCLMCPVQTDCAAKATGQPSDYPVKTRKLKRSSQSIWLLCLTREDGAVWLEQRPTPGVWAGLYAFALFGDEDSALDLLSPSQRAQVDAKPALKHVLTHKDMHLHPLDLRVTLKQAGAICSTRNGRWFLPQDLQNVGLPAPIQRMLAL